VRPGEHGGDIFVLVVRLSHAVDCIFGRGKIKLRSIYEEMGCFFSHPEYFRDWEPFKRWLKHVFWPILGELAAFRDLESFYSLWWRCSKI
jgi:hypothetical protein